MTVGSCEFESHLLHINFKISCGNSSVGRAQPARKKKGNQPWQGNAKQKLKRKTYNKRGNSSVGRAQPCQGWGREFEPRFPL